MTTKKYIDVENFRVFGKKERIEFSDVTLLIGPNSSGKSTSIGLLELLIEQIKTNENPLKALELLEIYRFKPEYRGVQEILNNTLNKDVVSISISLDSEVFGLPSFDSELVLAYRYLPENSKINMRLINSQLKIGSELIKNVTTQPYMAKKVFSATHPVLPVRVGFYF